MWTKIGFTACISILKWSFYGKVFVLEILPKKEKVLNDELE